MAEKIIKSLRGKDSKKLSLYKLIPLLFLVGLLIIPWVGGRIFETVKNSLSRIISPTNAQVAGQWCGPTWGCGGYSSGGTSGGGVYGGTIGGGDGYGAPGCYGCSSGCFGCSYGAAGYGCFGCGFASSDIGAGVGGDTGDGGVGGGGVGGSCVGGGVF